MEQKKAKGIFKRLARLCVAASQKQLQELCERAVPKNLVALPLDGKHYRDACGIMTLGIDSRGPKHVLGQ